MVGLRVDGLEGFHDTATPWIAVPPRRRVRGVSFVVQRTVLARRDLATVAGLPAVTPNRGVIDAASRVDDRTIRVGVDDGRRRGLVALERLLQRATALGTHPGAVAVRRLFGSGALDQDGELERALAVALAELDLLPAWGVEVLPGVIVDACFAEASYVLECDGVRWHTVEADRAADLSREGLLRADGWRVDRIRATDLRNRRMQVLATIEAVRKARIAAGLGRPDGWRPVSPGRRVRPPRA